MVHTVWRADGLRGINLSFALCSFDVKFDRNFLSCSGDRIQVYGNACPYDLLKTLPHQLVSFQSRCYSAFCLGFIMI